MEFLWIIAWAAMIIGGIFAVYNLFHYVLFLLATHPKDASGIGHELNEFERRQQTEWMPTAEDFLKHDDENRTYDDVFGTYRSENANYSTCVFPRSLFGHRYECDYILLNPSPGMRLLELGSGSGAAADYIASRCDVEILCVTNSRAQEEICQRKFKKYGGRVQVMVTDFDALDLPEGAVNRPEIDYGAPQDNALSHRRWASRGAWNSSSGCRSVFSGPSASVNFAGSTFAARKKVVPAFTVPFCTSTSWP